jgi:hypothetical protein
MVLRRQGFQLSEMPLTHVDMVAHLAHVCSQEQLKTNT